MHREPRSREDHEHGRTGATQACHLGANVRRCHLVLLDSGDVRRLGAEALADPAQVVLPVAVVLLENGDLCVRAVAGDRLTVDPPLEGVVRLPAARPLERPGVTAPRRGARRVEDLRALIPTLAAQLQAVQTVIGSIEKRIVAQHRSNEASKRLETIPGIGVVGATTITAVVTDPKAFRSGRDFAAWIGIVPRQDSTGGKQKLGPISKQGDQYLRRILIVGAHSVLRRARQQPEKYPWLTQLLARRPFKVVAVALANKMARIAWALLARGGTYRAPQLVAV